MNPENIMLSEIRQLQNKKYYIIHFYDVSKVIKCMKAKSRMMAARAWGEGETVFQCVVSVMQEGFAMQQCA